MDTFRVYAISKLDWIRQQQKKLQEQERETRREYIDRESHLCLGPTLSAQGDGEGSATICRFAA